MIGLEFYLEYATPEQMMTQCSQPSLEMKLLKVDPPSGTGQWLGIVAPPMSQVILEASPP